MEVIEYGKAISIEIERSEANEILKTSELWRRRLKLTEQPFRLTSIDKNLYTLQARGIAGFIRIGKKTLEVAPKFLNKETVGPGWRNAMWRLLVYGRGIEALSEASGQTDVDEGIADLLADIFLTSLKGAATRGYTLGYQSRKINSSFVSGRLDPQQYSKLLPVTGKIGVITTTLTNDTPINRLLKWAGNELARNVESPSRRKQLNVWATELPNVPVFPPKIEQISQNNHQYHHLTHAIEIAKLLLEDREVSYGNGAINLPGFLWDSNDLFERATRRLLSEACNPLELNVSKRTHTLAKTTSNSGKESGTYTIPDIDIWRGDHSVFIVDSKYKTLGRNPSNEDFYQILAAGRVRDVSSVALLYPATGTGVNGRKFKPIGTGNPTTVLVTTIGLESFSSRSKIRSLTSEITEWVNASISIPVQ